MDMVSRSGLMEQNTKDFGLKEKLKETGNLCMRMEIFMKVNGKMIRQMDLEFITIKMVQSMKAIGKMIYNMEKEGKVGQREVCMKDNIMKVKRMGLVNMFGLIAQAMKGAGYKIQ